MICIIIIDVQLIIYSEFLSWETWFFFPIAQMVDRIN